MYEHPPTRTAASDVSPQSLEVTIKALVPAADIGRANMLIQDISSELGGIAVPGTLQVQFAESVPPPNPFEQYDLTPREADVVRQIARGLTNAQIGAELGIRTATVKSHVLRTLAKTGTGNRAGLVHLLFGGDIPES